MRSAAVFVVVVLVLLAIRPLLLRPALPANASETTIERLSRLHGCRSDGLPEGVVPKRAIVRDGETSVRLTSFDEGWQMYTGKRPGTLVAVCAN